MNFITTWVVRRYIWCLIVFCIPLFILMCAQARALTPPIFTITKTNNASNPIPSGQIFTYTIAYTWMAWPTWSPTNPGTLIITDTIPSTLDVISAAPSNPTSTIAGNIVTFTLSKTSPAGFGFVQINVRFKPGVTCPDTRACNTAWIKDAGASWALPSGSNCAMATASYNKWEFEKRHIYGCRIDSVDEVHYQIAIRNPSGNNIGGLNLTNISLKDILPPGAIITNVTPLTPIPVIPGEWNGAFPVTGTATFTNTPGPAITSLNVQPGWGWWGCNVFVRYPAGAFTDGEVVTNVADLNFYTPCYNGPSPLVMSYAVSNILCDDSIIPPPLPDGLVQKGLHLGLYFPSNPWYTPSWAPGCCGTYTVRYTNSGAVTQSGIIINDTLPPTLDVGNIIVSLPAGMTSVNLEVFCYVGGVCQATPTVTIPFVASGSYSPSGLPPICRLRWIYTGNLAPGVRIDNDINVCVRTNSYVAPFPAVTAGDHIINKVCVRGTNVPPAICASQDQVVTPTAPNIRAAKFFVGKSGTCLPGCSPSTAGPFYPGDILRWRMTVTNVGNATATPCTITDVLPSGFSYVGNPTYYYGGPLYWASPTTPSCCAMTATVPSQIGGISSPSVGATTLIWTFPTLPAKCDGTVEYLVIEFDVKADDNPTIPPGSYFNTFTFSAGNLPAPVTSNPAQVVINGYAEAQIYKDVRQNLPSATFSSSASAQPGGTVEYRLRIQNTGILSLANLYLLDIMPHIGDILVLPPYVSRGSGFDLPLTTPVPVPAVTGYLSHYNNAGTTKNPTRSVLFCGAPADPGGVTPGSFVVPLAPPTYSFDITGLPATTLPAGHTQDFFFTATVPPGTAIGANACNSFAFQATAYGTTICQKAESYPACVTVIPPDNSACLAIWGDPEFDECCSFNTTIKNTIGDLLSLQYNVLPVAGGIGPSGLVKDVTTSPCLPSSTIPASLAGTTSGTLNFTPPCGGPTDVEFETVSTMVDGKICVELIAIFDDSGVPVECRDTICYRCDSTPKNRCDSLRVRPLPHTGFSMRDFIIYNLKSPLSPICDVKISVTPSPGGGLIGGGLVIDGKPQTWTSENSAEFTAISQLHGLPANTLFSFDLGIDYLLGWKGSVTITLYHCDGQICVLHYNPWDATTGGPIVVGNPVELDLSSLFMHRLEFSREDAAGKGIRSIAINYDDPLTEVVAVTGATYPCEPDAAEAGECDDLFGEVRVADRAILIDLRRDLDDEANLSDPTITVVYRGENESPVPVKIIYYDEHGQEIGYEEMEIEGGDPPGQIVSGLDGEQSIAAIMGSLTAHPNPTTGRCDLGFTLSSASTVELELLDMRGTRVATVINGERLAAGEHHRLVDMEAIPSGIYLVSLRVNGVPSVLRVELVK